MEQNRMYAAAREILRGLEDVTLDRVTVGEALFLFRKCLRTPEHGWNVTAEFKETDLQELIRIGQAILARRSKRDVH